MSAPAPTPHRATVAALQDALATEHAAVWAYGLISAFVPPELTDQVDEAATAHRARRDATERILSDTGVEPVPTEPAYRTPSPVIDLAGALVLAVTAEGDTAAAWRAVIENSGVIENGGVLERHAQPGLRTTALDALVGAAVRASRWRSAAGAPVRTVPFPGAP
jgi:hypothetical protein